MGHALCRCQSPVSQLGGSAFPSERATAQAPALARPSQLQLGALLTAPTGLLSALRLTASAFCLLAPDSLASDQGPVYPSLSRPAPELWAGQILVQSCQHSHTPFTGHLGI